MKNLSLKGRVYPTDLNHSGGVFGGWIMSKMDKAASIAIDEIILANALTVSVTDLHFKEPVRNGDIFSIYTTIENIGSSSIKVHVDFEVKNHLSNKLYSVVDAHFTFVAIDRDGKPIPVHSVLRPDAPQEIVTMAKAGVKK
jgi:acyl-CoA thioesterase YciA